MTVRYRPQLWQRGAWRNFPSAYSFGTKGRAKKHLVRVRKLYRDAKVKMNRTRVLKYDTSR